MRRHAGLLLVMGLSGCAGFKPLERGEWVLAWSDEVVQTQMVNGTAIEVVKPAPGARQEVIPLDRYEAETTEGKRRKVISTFANTPKEVFEINEPIELMIGEVKELRVAEPKEVLVSVAGDSVKAYWTQANRVDEWKDGKSIEHSESTLFLLADDPGTSKVKVQLPGQEPHLIEVSVRPR